HGKDVTAGLSGAIEHGWVRRRDGIVAPVSGPDETLGRRTDERPSDDPPDPKRIDQSPRDGADVVEPLKPKGALVRGNLKDAVGRCVTNRFAGRDVVVAELGDD